MNQYELPPAPSAHASLGAGCTAVTSGPRAVCQAGDEAPWKATGDVAAQAAQFVSETNSSPPAAAAANSLPLVRNERIKRLAGALNTLAITTTASALIYRGRRSLSPDPSIRLLVADHWDYLAASRNWPAYLRADCPREADRSLELYLILAPLALLALGGGVDLA